MTDLSSLATDEDTGRVRAEASRKDASDPGGELRGLTVAFIQHEDTEA